MKMPKNYVTVSVVFLTVLSINGCSERLENTLIGGAIGLALPFAIFIFVVVVGKVFGKKDKDKDSEQ